MKLVSSFVLGACDPGKSIKLVYKGILGNRVCGKVPTDNDVSGCASKRYKRNSLRSRTELGSKFRGGQNLNKKNSLKYKLAYI